MNPILPLNDYIPDVEARVWADGRMYLYGSMDIGGRMDYCSHAYRVFSSADVRQWTDHGVSFQSTDTHTSPDKPLYAPDCLCLDDTYHLLYCCSDKSEGWAVSDQPYGPFTQARSLAPADKDGIDPAGLLDDDGSVYYFWGQIRLRGARLRTDRSGLDASSVQPALLNESEHGFHEGASIRKRKGIYYMVYADISRGKPTCLGYATSRSPLGPYEKRGIIIDNVGCDPMTWNNHGSIAEFNGQWMVFYHRSSHGSIYSRRVCVEPIHFNEAGDIAEVEMTTQGLDGPLDPRKPIDASRACLMAGNIRATERNLQDAEEGDWAAFKYFDFTRAVTTFHLERRIKEGEIEVRLDAPDGPLLGRVRDKSIMLQQSITGQHALYLVFRGARPQDLQQFWFA